MKSYLHSTMDWNLGSDRTDNHPCQVRVGDAELVVSYTHLGDRHLWKGTSQDGKTYEVLHVGNPADEARLIRTSDSTLEGPWIEAGRTGNWLIDLEDEP
ncbi:hypothetical protein [Bosea sp. AK1]|uniref:hypothetical protein n=1 Tax=Bosea sp. AK1 TaxID=2587160 RepID=UPI0011530779|nr:hypothetical protein [Bosea sp. AK1]